MIVPCSPWGTFSDVSRTSRLFSLKIARSRRSSADSSVSPLGVTLPTRMSPGRTSAPMRMMPRSSRSFSRSGLTLGRSRVISSLPSFVSRASTSYSSMWIDERVVARALVGAVELAQEVVLGAALVELHRDDVRRDLDDDTGLVGGDDVT